LIRISVVLPTYNSASVLGETLRHLAAQDYPRDAYEVIVVDDGSTDATPDVLAAASAAFPVRVIRQANGGRSRARNTGANAARFEVILFVDADVFADPPVLRMHAGHFENGGKLGVQGPSYTHPASRVGPFMEAKELLPDLTVRKVRDLNPVHVITRNFSIDAAAFRAIGGFDETFTGYGWEDIELAMRLREIGVRFLWEPRAVTWHHHVENLTSALRKQTESGRGAVYFWRKHGEPAWLGFFLEIHPLLLPLKWVVFRSGLFTRMAWRLLRWAEPPLQPDAPRPARGLQRKARIAICNGCYVHLMWDAYYAGVFAARQAPAAAPIAASGAR